MGSVTQILLSVGGYVISLLLGIVLFLLKRELSQHEESRKIVETKIAAVESAHRLELERHAEKHQIEAAKLDERRERLNDEVQKVRNELLEHCADASERFLSKDEFVSSTAYLTKKTDEVNRLLQSIENLLSRR